MDGRERWSLCELSEHVIALDEQPCPPPSLPPHPHTFRFSCARVTWVNRVALRSSSTMLARTAARSAIAAGVVAGSVSAKLFMACVESAVITCASSMRRSLRASTMAEKDAATLARTVEAGGVEAAAPLRVCACVHVGVCIIVISHVCTRRGHARVDAHIVTEHPATEGEGRGDSGR